VGEAALHYISQPDVLQGVTSRHTYLVSALCELGKRHGLFEGVRGIGLLLGCVLTEPWQGRARELVEMFLSHGVMVLQAGPDVIRLAPSLVIEQGELDEGLARLEAAAMRLSHVQQSTSEIVEM
jgi:acetylornithine/N-succinyldiaminopimelate aminotransferase